MNIRSTQTGPEYIPVGCESDLVRVQAKIEWIHTYFDHNRERHVDQHRSLDTFLSHNPIQASGMPSPLEYEHRSLPGRLVLPACQATYLSVPPLAIDYDQLLGLIGTRGILVWQGGAIAAEQYLESHTPETRWMTNSASKLVVAMLVAAALDSGALDGTEQLLTDLAPELTDTAWDGVTIGHCMSMTTGVGWVEESLDLMSDSPFTRLLYQVAFGSIESFIATIPRRSEPGTELIYSSIDTEALGTALARTTGSIARYLEETIWVPAGMEHDAYWITDPTGRELALSGLCATLRDYARLGLILLHSGSWNSKSILPTRLAEQLSAPGPATFTLPGHDDYPLVCWQQAFIPCHESDNQGDYMAAGGYGQLIYVNPACDTVIAHQGVFADLTTEYIDMYRMFMAFRQIAETLAS